MKLTGNMVNNYDDNVYSKCAFCGESIALNEYNEWVDEDGMRVCDLTGGPHKATEEEHDNLHPDV